MEKVITHFWVEGFGWETTIYQEGDFDSFEKLGENKDGIIWIGFSKTGHKHILKGYFKKLMYHE